MMVLEAVPADEPTARKSDFTPLAPQARQLLQGL
jgi:hypothetical protein